MKKIILLLVVITFFECKTEPIKKIDSIDQIPELNSFVNDSIRTEQNSKFFSINFGTAKKFTSTMRKGSEFHISWDDNKQIDHILTHDSNFKTKEGVHVHMKLKDLLEIQKNKIEKTKDWAYTVKLNSGWYAGFPIHKEKALSQMDSITVLFKKTEDKN